MFLYRETMHLSVKKKAKFRLDQRNAKKFNFKDIPEDKSNLILQSDVAQLRQLQIDGRVTSYEIVTVFAKRCHRIGRKLNLVTEEYYDEALLTAQDKDRERELAVRNGRANELGLLHGIPVSIKDHVNEQGRHVTVGVMSFCDNIAKSDAVVVQQWKDQGAIPMVKGNVPQLVFALQTENDIYGRALNPHDATRSCGGSSGGDAGLVASRCVPLALGTDIGGSIRGPACFNGVYGFKPTANRVSYKGCIIPLEDGTGPQGPILPVAGPLGYTSNDLLIATKSLMNQTMFDRDLDTAPLPFNEQRYQQTLNKRKLRFGYFEETDFMGASDATREKLEALGHEVVPFNFHHNEAFEYIEIFVASCSIGVLGQFCDMMESKHDKFITIYQESFLFYTLPRFLQKIVVAIFSTCISKRKSATMGQVRKYSSDDIDNILRRRARFVENFMQRWDDMKLDGLISPAFPSCAFKHADANELAFLVPFLALQNVLNFPSGIVPITEVQNGEDVDTAIYDKANDLITRHIKNSMRDSFGMPIGVQISTPKWKDEECLAIMKIVGDQFKFMKKTPEL
ncbi:amidase family protein [Stylonychia lemnae]|uniref:Amidase family protein n=1 Tax=Stylonychia lemnae TaxID=5949 RepID=A0A078AHA7_STYLE|nr:amidase family protein [Stylonychia lemnae]|eukprot:CDW81226.1 amidase family protein [Stylonychia lemnae]